MKFIKIKQKDNDFYNFYVLLPNGVKVRVMPNKYKDKSNYSILCLIAEDYE